ncbi:elongation factor P 5-aminopentanone reductase [Aneurinibacillus tyrosinisolvens]|uniref:elongation factor P 5-aminopentanone reductase n=1 Tax=Aneurinibacillus tyrosinisolvens TaxID=1443435 RepID=UPI00063FB909|nr:3-oxoacyl-ACP reductase FabG [Aneurinibacillus tyrosinisolvens]
MGEEKRKWACITGASRGIGAAIAVSLAKAGFHLFIHYHASLHEAQAVAERCRNEGSQTLLVQADLTAADGVERMFSQFPCPVDVLVLNAGISGYGLVQDVTVGQWEAMMNIHVRAPFFCAKAALPHMIRQRWGRIITVSSIWGITGASYEVLYSTAKGAVISFTKALAREVAPSGITVNCIAPGLIDTDMMTGSFTDEQLDFIKEEIPAGRMGTPGEVAALAAFLVSGEAAYLSGQVISPNGAWHC